jgi:hypothetical protein
MSELTAAIGAKIYIGASNWTHDTLSEFDGQTTGWTEIGLVENIPEFGTKWETGSFVPVGDGLKRKYKTVQDNGSLTITAARSGSDAGQDAAKAAADDKQNAYAIKVILGDDPGGTGSKPSRFYFYALVTSATVNPGGAGDTVRTTIGLEITSVIVEGDAVAGS